MGKIAIALEKANQIAKANSVKNRHAVNSGGDPGGDITIPWEFIVRYGLILAAWTSFWLGLLFGRGAAW